MGLAQGQWQRFLLEAPEYPQGIFQGKGIVILAGGPQYLVPAWVNVRMLRKAGKLACDGLPLVANCQAAGLLHPFLQVLRG